LQHWTEPEWHEYDGSLSSGFGLLPGIKPEVVEVAGLLVGLGLARLPVGEG